PADGPEAEFAGQRQVLPPMVVVPHQLVLVECAMARADLRHEGVLDTAGPEEIAGAPKRAGLPGRNVAGHCRPSATLWMDDVSSGCRPARDCSAAFRPATKAWSEL